MPTVTEAPYGLVGQSARMRHVQTLIEKLGRSKWPALLLGETGTGKEVVARAIHNVSPLGPFVTIDCSSMVGPLMESELFGHVKGSFTGAVMAKPGLIELANGGTAFFDEVGELPLELQAKLLRVLQEKEFRPVGSVQTRRSDFRVIAATNRELAKEVDKGMFRKDLFYRLNVVTVKLAPLRERRDDIPGLVEFFLDKYGHGQVVDDAALELMMDYNWPGNVRELENAVQQMVALDSGPVLGAASLPSPLRNFQLGRQLDGYSSSPLPSQLRLPSEGGSPIVPLAEVERRAILQAIEYTRGDRALAAHLLGIGRTTLYRKLKEYGVAEL